MVKLRYDRYHNIIIHIIPVESHAQDQRNTSKVVPFPPNERNHCTSLAETLCPTATDKIRFSSNDLGPLGC